MVFFSELFDVDLVGIFVEVVGPDMFESLMTISLSASIDLSVGLIPSGSNTVFMLLYPCGTFPDLCFMYGFICIFESETESSDPTEEVDESDFLHILSHFRVN